MSNHGNTLQFISLYHSHPTLWDVRRKEYTNKMKRIEAINDISKKTNMTAKEVKNKIKSLRSYFAKEHSKVTKRNSSGSDGDEVYESPWFGYQPLMFIIDSLSTKEADDSCSQSFDASNTLFVEHAYSEENGEDNNISMGIEVVESKDYKFTRPIRTKNKLKRPLEQQEEPTAIKFVSVETDEMARKDECSVFGEMIAGQIRKLNRRNQAIAKHEISNVLFRLEMDEIDASASTASHQTSSPSNLPADLNQSVLKIDR